MTTKERAEKLHNKYWEYCENRGEAKEYAAMAVDEILEVLKDLDVTYSKIQYWEEVKQEIEQL